MIEVDNLIKHYGAAKAVDGISFRVEPGEVLGLLGPNGAGKSTTLRVLTGYIPPTSGSVRLGGANVQDDALAARRRLGYLSETNPLYESLGVWECLELAAGVRGIPDGSRAARIADAIRRCSLGAVISKDVGELSKGYRQRLGLALAILHDPEFLILDEPTSALDPNQQREVRGLILELKQRKTVILSTHILSEAQELCDRLVIIHRGKIVAQGTVAELQGRAGEGSYYLRLKAPAGEALAALASLPSAPNVRPAGEAEGWPGFDISCAADPRQDVFDLAAARRWTILELRRETASLDEVFRSLTGGAQ